MRLSLQTTFWSCFGLAAANYAVMVLWSLPLISAAADGAAPFDLRPMGYSVAQAQEFIEALTDEDRAFYLNVQHRLDTTYPALLALTLGLGSYLLSPPTWSLTKWLGGAFAFAGAVFDYLENFQVARIIESKSKVLDPALVTAASQATVAKSVLTTLAMTVLLAMLVLSLYRWWAHRSAGKTS
jgi:hypothetical protein